MAFLAVRLWPRKPSKSAALNDIYEKGTFTIGFLEEMGGFSSVSKEGEYSGFDEEVAKEIVARLFEYEVDIEYITVDSKSARVALINGEADMVFAHFPSKSESKIIYSSEYFKNSVGFYVPEYGIDSIAQIGGKKIGVVNGSYAASNLSGFLKDKNIDCEIITYSSYPDVFDSLERGKIDVVAAGTIMIDKYKTNGRVLEGTVLPFGLTISLAKADSNVKYFIDEIIAEMKKDGTLAALMIKWEVDKFYYSN